MASVVRRKNGSWEIRESITTPDGPRSKTLATFRVLTDPIARRAAAKASRPTSAEAIIDAARRKGAPVTQSAADMTAAQLLRLIDRGVPLSERMRRLLADRVIPGAALPDGAREGGAWAAATPQERGDAIVDLLHLVDALPPPAFVSNAKMPRLEKRHD